MLRGKLEGGRGGRHLQGLGARAGAGWGGRLGRHTTGLVPVYPATEGLSARRIRELAFMVRGLEVHAPEPLGARLRAGAALAGKADAIASAHWPESLDEVPVARRRLAFEELFLFQLALVMRRRTRSETREAELLGAPGALVREWLDSLPFEPTDGQRKALERDRCGPRRPGGPMHRLLMGEVGSGKTVVALYAMLRVAEAGMQAALMAPTETLAEQHFATIGKLIGDGLFAGEDATRLGPAGGHADRLDAGARAGRGARAAAHRRAAAAGRHPRPDPGRGRVRPARARGRGRAAPLRRAPARGARRQGARRAGAAPAAPDRHADPAHAVADAVRRSRHDGAARAAVGTPPGEDVGRARAQARGRVRLHPRAPAGRTPVLCGLPAGGGVRGASGAGGHGRGASASPGASCATSRWPSCTGRCTPARSAR